ncbi:MAG: alpha/beta hydrolase-fold protein [Bacteroidota bacterium]
MKNLTLYALLSIFMMQASFAQEGLSLISERDFSIGKSLKLQSQILGEERTLNIYLPLSYQRDSLKKYPVIYLLDGSEDEDFIHIAGLVQFGSFSWINMLPESIVVGIANVDRRRDFTLKPMNEEDKKDFPTAGGAPAFMDFIRKEVQVFVRDQFRTDTLETLIGQSLGGFFASYTLFTQPDMFDNYVIVSPSTWWDNDYILRSTPTVFRKPVKVYIAVGKEGKIMEEGAKALYELVKGYEGDNLQPYFQFFPNKDHGDALHMAVYDAFEKLFIPRK